MDEWELDLRISNDACPFRNKNNFCRAYSNWCTCEICETMVDSGPITAGWLESVGIHSDIGYYWICIKGSDGVSVENSMVWVTFYTQRRRMPHIKTRHQFRELYKALSGKELGDA